MPFIDVVSDEDASGPLAEIYARLQAALGYVPNYARTFSHRPALFEAWQQLNSTIKSAMEPRRYELATIAAASRRRSSYCVLAHGEKLLELGSAGEELKALVTENSSSHLDPTERAVFAFATKVAADPASIDAVDVDGLRKVGLSDAEIFDVAAAAAARLFFIALQDAMGTQPDAAYRDSLAGLTESLAVGRPIEDGPSAGV